MASLKADGQVHSITTTGFKEISLKKDEVIKMKT